MHRCAHPRPAEAPWAAADALLFDIDGTLLNVRDPVQYFAFQNALREVFGIDADLDGVPLAGNTDVGILRAVLLRHGIDGAAFERDLGRLIEVMCAEVDRNAHRIRAEVCPGVMELLEALHARGRLLGVVSGNLERIGWRKLEAAGLRHRFAFGAFSDGAERRADIFRNGIAEARRRLGASARLCIIGDTPADVHAAREVGVPIVAVATGAYSPAQLLEQGPDACFPCCEQLLPLLRGD